MRDQKKEQGPKQFPEYPVIRKADASVQPVTVVIEIKHTDIALTAVFGGLINVAIAYFAVHVHSGTVDCCTVILKNCSSFL